MKVVERFLLNWVHVKRRDPAVVRKRQYPAIVDPDTAIAGLTGSNGTPVWTESALDDVGIGWVPVKCRGAHTGSTGVGSSVAMRSS